MDILYDAEQFENMPDEDLMNLQKDLPEFQAVLGENDDQAEDLHKVQENVEDQKHDFDEIQQVPEVIMDSQSNNA